MAITFPTEIDELTNPVSTDALNSPSHSDQHSDINDAVEALETKVGIDSSADTDSHDYKLSHLTASDITDLTASADELNKLDGTDAVVADFDKLHDITSSASELNQLDDVEVGGTGSGDIATTDDTQTLTNKTLTSPVLTAPTFAGLVDGWISAEETWTYASATTITVPSGAASKYQKGDKIKLTQTTVKYFYITVVADTLLTVTGGSDYTVANAAITENYFSKAENPLGFPHWFNYTPTYGGFSANPTTLTRFCIIGTSCIVNFCATANGTSNATTLTISIPITAETITNYGWRSNAVVVDNGTVSDGSMYIASAGTSASFYKAGLGAFTNSGNKSANGQIVYEIT